MPDQTEAEQEIRSAYQAPEADLGTDKRKEPITGFRNWLILPAIGVVLAPFILTFALVNQVLPTFEPHIWNAVTAPGSLAYHSLWAPLLYFELIVTSVLLVWATTHWYFMFAKKRIFPKLFIAYLATATITNLIEAVLAMQIPQLAENRAMLMRPALRTLVYSAIWIPYFLRSEQVKRTFTR